MSDNMYFDTDTFNFDDIVDVVEHEAPKTSNYTKANQVGPDGGQVSDASDLMGDEFSFPEDEPAPDPEFDPNQDLSDFIDPNAETEETVKIINDLADDIPLDIGGEVMTKAQIREQKARLQRVEQNADFLQYVADTFEQDNKTIEERLTYKDVAVDYNIQYLKNCMEAAQDQQSFNDFKGQLKEAEAMKARIEADAKIILEKRNENQKNLTRNRWVSTDAKMMEVYPDWLKWRDHLISDALQRGYKPSYIEKSYDPVFAQTLLESYQYRQNKQASQTNALTKAKQAGAAKSISNKSSAKEIAAADAKTAELRSLKKKMAQGGLERSDLSKMFNHLVD
ncbi:hypothetical protein [Klebsiella variicola]|uniref:hypothetical protein n=1 Tax=Klebsiella variicola TaxID=244366 RepID=UPI00240636A4|nr:hypothetical protein [Klebsiella variicola]MDG0490081.1 hypothetical protein [Klebsiella variicola]